MSIKQKAKTYSFWVSLTSAIILVIKLFGNQFGFSVDESTLSDMFTAICGILVILGIVVVPAGVKNQSETTKKNNRSNVITKIVDIPIVNAVKTESDIVVNNTSDEPVQTADVTAPIVEEINNTIQIPIEEVKIEDMTNAEVKNEIEILDDIDESLNEEKVIQIKNEKPINDETFINFKKTLEEEKEKFASNLNLYLDMLKNEIDETIKQNNQ